jgi:2-polyprenyl-3-methyl-5-hydroxy-6-metoxy-1,4-benzoquinol methylase
MSKLTDRSYWDQFHEEILVPKDITAEPAKKSLPRRLLGERLYSYRLSYHHHRLFNVILPKFLPQQKGLKVVELGSAPGRFLIDFKNRFGYDPYGLEYSEVGIQNNRGVFEQNGVDPDQVIPGDVLDPELINQHRESFDIVMSMSFIEHFENTAAIVQAHVDLLKPGGTLVIIAPNLSGLNRQMYGFFNPKDLAAHNLKITNVSAFRELFHDLPVEPLFCDAYGVFSFQLYKPVPGTLRAKILRIGKVMQQGINIMHHALRGDTGRGLDGTCPYLLYVGRKKS